MKAEINENDSFTVTIKCHACGRVYEDVVIKKRPWFAMCSGLNRIGCGQLLTLECILKDKK